MSNYPELKIEAKAADDSRPFPRIAIKATTDGVTHQFEYDIDQARRIAREINRMCDRLEN